MQSQSICIVELQPLGLSHREAASHNRRVDPSQPNNREVLSTNIPYRLFMP